MEKRILHPVSNSPGMFLWWCPGCEEAHGVWTDVPNSLTRAKWRFNGNLDAPTFTPSILTRGSKFTAKGEADYAKYMKGEIPLPDRFDSADTRCHVHIANGQISYLADCSHRLAGKTVPMQPF